MLLQEAIKYEPKQIAREEKKTKRITYIDTAKAIAIFLTIVSHSRAEISSY